MTNNVSVFMLSSFAIDSRFQNRVQPANRADRSSQISLALHAAAYVILRFTRAVTRLNRVGHTRATISFQT